MMIPTLRSQKFKEKSEEKGSDSYLLLRVSQKLNSVGCANKSGKCEKKTAENVQTGVPYNNVISQDELPMDSNYVSSEGRPKSTAREVSVGLHIHRNVIKPADVTYADKQEQINVCTFDFMKRNENVKTLLNVIADML